MHARFGGCTTLQQKEKNFYVYVRSLSLFFRALRNTHERISLFRPHSASLQCLKCSTIFSNSARGFGAFPYETHPILCFDVCVCTPVSLGNLARAKC